MAYRINVETKILLQSLKSRQKDAYFMSTATDSYGLEPI